MDAREASLSIQDPLTFSPGWAKIQNPIITIEGPEERNLQFAICFLINNFRLAFGRSILTRTFTAPINDFDFSVCTHRIVSRHGIGAFLLECIR